MKKSTKRIGITCTSIFHYVHFKYIVNELRERGFNVDYIIYTPKYTNNRFERIEKYFKDNNERFQSFEDVFSGNVKYDALLAPYFMPGFELLDSSIIKIRIMYGYAKDSWNYAEWNKGFDLILSYGPYATKRLINYTEVVEIGHPRVRLDYKNEIIDINGRSFIKVECQKPILVYCPTWANLSSLEIFTTYLTEITIHFEVIVKLHHGNVLAGSHESLKVIKQNQDLYLFDDHTDLFDLLNAADIILSDYSGAIFDAMIFKKPIILLDVIPEYIRETGQVNLSNMLNVNSSFSKESFANFTTSLDIAIREILSHVREKNELLNTLIDALERNTVTYESLLEKLYYSIDTRGSVRGATAVENFLIENDSSGIIIDNSLQVVNIEKVKDFLHFNSGETITIWGAGEIGQIIYVYLKSQGYSINFLYDGDTNKQGKNFYDKQISSILIYSKVLIATANAYQFIKETLEKKGLHEGLDFISIFSRDDI